MADFNLDMSQGMAQVLSNMFRMMNQINNWGMPETIFPLPATFVGGQIGQQSPASVAFDNIAPQTQAPQAPEAPAPVQTQAPVDQGVSNTPTPQAASQSFAPPVAKTASQSNVVIPFDDDSTKKQNGSQSESLF